MRVAISTVVAILITLVLWPFYLIAYYFGAIFYTVILAFRRAAKITGRDDLECTANMLLYGSVTVKGHLNARVVKFES